MARKSKLLDLLVYIYAVAFFIFRGGELAYLLEDTKFWSTILTSFLFVVWYMRLSFSLYLKALIACGIYFFDFYYFDFPEGINESDFKGKHILITGANSGVGFAAAVQASELGAVVYLACRSVLKCEAARDLILTSEKLTGEVKTFNIGLDLTDLQSVSTFASRFKTTKIDILLNNAGFGNTVGAKQTKDGLEKSFGAMHVGHFYLTKLLVEQQNTKTSPMRVVNVASGTHYVCLSVKCFHDKGAEFKKAMRGQSDVLAYYRAKVSNVLHALELPNRYEGVTALSVNLGFVGTSINGLKKLGELGLQRHASVGVRPMLAACVAPVTPETNGYIMNDLYDVAFPLVPYNIALYWALKVPIAGLKATGVEKTRSDKFGVPLAEWRDAPHATVAEVTGEAKWLYDVTDELLQEVL